MTERWRWWWYRNGETVLWLAAIIGAVLVLWLFAPGRAQAHEIPQADQDELWDELVDCCITGQASYYAEQRAKTWEVRHAVETAFDDDTVAAAIALVEAGVVSGSASCYFPSGGCGERDHEWAVIWSTHVLAEVDLWEVPGWLTFTARRPVERWRPLVERYFPPERVNQAMRVMRCESRGVPWVKNRRSSATGLFQHLDRFMRNNAWRIGAEWYDRRDPESNVAVTAAVVEADGGWRQWSCKP